MQARQVLHLQYVLSIHRCKPGRAEVPINPVRAAEGLDRGHCPALRVGAG
jgi:hypothetical protein